MIVTLLVTVVIVMMLGATLALSPGRTARAGSTSDQALAEGAVEAGIEYARARLQEDSTWKADDNRIVVNEPNLYIEEQDGMVVGLIRPTDSEPYSMFRMRFNYYNGSPLGGLLDDGLPDPPPAFRFDMRDVSVNNLEGGLRFVPVPDSFSNIVMDFLSGRIQIPSGTASITVEGFGGAGLSGVGPGSYEVPPGSRRVARRIADVVFAAAFKDGSPDAAMMGGGRIDLTLPTGSGEVKVTAKGATPRARTKGSVEMNVGGGNSPNFVSSGELLYDIVAGETVDESSGTVLGDDGGQPFYELEWNDIHQASSDPAEAIHLDAGTYVFKDDGTLHYFQMSWADYKTQTAAWSGAGQDPFDHAGNGVVSKQVDANLANVRTDSMPSNVATLSGSKVKFEADVLVQPVAAGPGTLSDFTLVPQRGTQSSSSNLTDLTATGGSSFQKDVELELKPSGKGKVAITGSGDMLIAAKLNSDKGGSLITQGNLRLDAGKLDKFGNVGVSFYSQQDIEVSTYEPDLNKYLSVGVDGLFYAWNDFTLRAGDPGVPENKWDDIKLTGSVVAYGTDNGPNIEPPGSNLGGVLSVTASSAEFKWDSKKLGDLLSTAKFGDLTVLERSSYLRR